MREVATFEDEHLARRFADVLCARDIASEVSQKREGTFAVWVLEERQLDASRAAWAAFDANPDAPEHEATRGCVDRTRQRVSEEDRRSRHEVIQMRERLAVPPQGGVHVTIFLVVTSVTVTLLTAVGKRAEIVERLLIGSGDTPFLHHVLHGQVWRLVTPIFSHGSFLHIFFNMWWLLDLGGLLERRIGSGRFLGLVALSAVASNLLQYAAAGPYFGGMSGVIYALFGYAWMRGRVDPSLGIVMSQNTVVPLLVWLGLGFADVLPGMANYAHLGGLLFGGLAGALHARRA